MAASVPEYRMDVSLFICGGNFPVLALDRPDGGGDLHLHLLGEKVEFLSDFADGDCWNDGMPEGEVLADGSLRYGYGKSSRTFNDIDDLFEALQEGRGPCQAGVPSWGEDPRTVGLTHALRHAVTALRDADVEVGQGLREFIVDELEKAEKAVALGKEAP